MFLRLFVVTSRLRVAVRVMLYDRLIGSASAGIIHSKDPSFLWRSWMRLRRALDKFLL